MLIRTLATSLVLLAMASAPVIAGDNGKGKDKHKGHGHPAAAQAHGHHPGNAPKAQGRHDNGRHLGWQKQAWKRGDRIPMEYLEPVYYVDDYRAYRLPPPPQGHRWVKPVDDRYLLIEAATGLIADALGY